MKFSVFHKKSKAILCNKLMLTLNDCILALKRAAYVGDRVILFTWRGTRLST